MTITTTKTTTKRRSARKSTKPTGVRALLLALALSGTLGGWAALANSDMKESALAPAAPPLTTETFTPAADQSPGTFFLAPIPTIQPPPTDLDLSTTLQPLPEPAQLLPIPAVSRPTDRRPVTRTRSSR